jgi:hypothetical protein
LNFGRTNGTVKVTKKQWDGDGRECRHTCLNITVDQNAEEKDLLWALCAEK